MFKNFGSSIAVCDSMIAYLCFTFSLRKFYIQNLEFLGALIENKLTSQSYNITGLNKKFEKPY